jgi:glycosidase
MPWRPGPGAGFTKGRPWLPLPPDAATRNVEVQGSDPESVLAWYRRLLRLRRETPALQRGGQRLLEVGEANVLAFVRDGDGADTLVVLNFGDTPATIEVPAPLGGGAWRPALSTHGRPDDQAIAGSVTVAPLEALIVVAR